VNAGLLDWAILGAVYAALVGGALLTRRYMRSVADGFSMGWWGLSMAPFLTILAVSGWVTYRFRSTRCLTLAEFFERRYSRGFRIFAGVVAYAAGLFNFGIFPAVGARFFVYFMGLPEAWFPFVMVVLLLTALFFVFTGGQVAVIVTDFLQGLFSNFVFLIVPVYLLFVVDWSQVVDVLSDRPPGKSLVNPFDTEYIPDFNFWYFLIGLVGVMYSAMSWQGTAAYNTSAKSAHEAKMGGVLTMWRGIPQGLTMLLLPILAFTVMSHPDWTETARGVEEVIAGVENEAVHTQLRTPLVLAKLLPAGILGLFAAMMLAAFISTHNTYLHSWGSILIQDVVMPFRKRPLSPKAHLLVLRLSIVGVAIFIFLFSLHYEQTEEILLYFAITGAIFAGGSGAVIIGGLYWKRGTSGAAWAAMLAGSTIAVGGIVLQHYWKKAHGEEFPVNGQEFWGIGMGASVLVYAFVSLLVRPRVFNLDRLLHRGKFALADEYVVVEAAPSRGWKMLGIGKEFSRRDKALYLVTYAWTLLWTITFVVGTVVCLSHDVGNGPWLVYWRVFLGIQVAMSVVVIVWLSTAASTT
jgi:SSS family solute:Na+ symporter